MNPLRALPLAIAFALGLTVAGGVSAVATATPSTVKVCENSHGLVVAAKAKRCPNGSRAVTIAKRGPTGAAGKPGNNGVNGYSVVDVGHTVASSSTDLTSTSSVVSRIQNTPAGTYVGTYQVTTVNLGTSGTASCQFVTGTTALAPASDVVVPPGQAFGVEGSAPFTLATAGEIDLVCSATGSSALSVENATVAAIRINAAIQSD